ncbi:MAG: hypothetical protein K8S20_12810 [Chloroflexi bacterium]|nr:hypothetical protein [Chloroflexota bacterium]
MRQRKDDLGEKLYSVVIMNENLAISETSAADLLQATPQAVRFFIDHGTACAICSLARFCTLKDVILAYDLDEKAFMEDLAKLEVQKF